MHTTQPTRAGFWLVLGAAILWGTIGVAAQGIYNIESTNSLFINLARSAVAAPVLLVACWRVLGRRMFAITRRDFWLMALAGALLAFSHAAYFASIRAAGVTIATLLTICVAPLVVAGASAWLKFEVLTWRVGVALGCALVGSILLVGGQAQEGTQGDVLLGAVYALIAAATYGAVIVCGRFLAGEYHSLQVTSIMFAVGALVLLPLNIVGGVAPLQTVNGWLLAAYLGIVPSALAYWMFQTGLRAIPATAASIISMLDPLVAALLAWALFGETLALVGILGAGLLIVSLFLLNVTSSK
jgi:drug/metabolite transporter, DME family